jgi:Protein NO VEIN, C-terminal
MDGEPVLVYGEAATESDDGHSGTRVSSGGEAGPPKRAAPGTDLAALDRLGMAITMGYEVHRLRRDGMASARIVLFEPGAAEDDSLVVDVHSPEAIQQAEEASAVVLRVMKELESRGISRLYPGFDVLTIARGQVDRLIELKSSGVDARVQAMSWNEWKSARASDIRTKFWLYLVGNLRADLMGAKPFVRGIKDPFGTLAHDEIENHQVTRAVQLRVREFGEAEHLDLGLVTTTHRHGRHETAPEEAQPT